MQGFLQGTKAFGNLLNELPRPSKQAEVWLNNFHTNIWYPPSTMDTGARQTDPRAFIWPAHYKRQKKKSVKVLLLHLHDPPGEQLHRAAICSSAHTATAALLLRPSAFSLACYSPMKFYICCLHSICVRSTSFLCCISKYQKPKL